MTVVIFSVFASGRVWLRWHSLPHIASAHILYYSDGQRKSLGGRGAGAAN